MPSTRWTARTFYGNAMMPPLSCSSSPSSSTALFLLLLLLTVSPSVLILLLLLFSLCFPSVHLSSRFAASSSSSSSILPPLDPVSCPPALLCSPIFSSPHLIFAEASSRLAAIRGPKFRSPPPRVSIFKGSHLFSLVAFSSFASRTPSGQSCLPAPLRCPFYQLYQPPFLSPLAATSRIQELLSLFNRMGPQPAPSSFFPYSSSSAAFSSSTSSAYSSSCSSTSPSSPALSCQRDSFLLRTLLCHLSHFSATSSASFLYPAQKGKLRQLQQERRN